MKKVEIYTIEEYDGRRTPKYEDIEECVKIANEKDCIVRLEWTMMRWPSLYKRDIYPGEDAQEIYDSLPHVYGL